MATFKIEVSDKCVDAKTAEVQPHFTAATVVTVLFCWGLGAYLLARILPSLGSLLSVPRSYNVWTWALMAGASWLATVYLWQGFRQMFPAGESLVCKDGSLTVGHIPDHVLNGRWVFQTFPIESVKQFSFGAVRSGRYGSTPGLIFNVDGHKKKVLAGLEAPEADQVLKGLSYLGVDTVRDPAMPMLIEMEMSRRKGHLGLL